MRDKLIYRQARPADAEPLKELAATTWSQFEIVIGAESWAYLSNALSKVNYSTLIDTSYGAICEVGDTIAGMAFLVPNGNPTDIFPADWCYVRMVTVDTAYTGKGIGRGLMSMCIEHARSQHEKVMGLHTSEFMNAARHIYESMGFYVVKELEPRFNKKYWLYRLDL
ncbi:GNAT family N-acetyltransferase [Chryseolinea sp. T2]|uniref:GNAT family N-acetyltransferase n=1 Tax=Chryseolinea sp. T2 TaxID=3129255 RepID=UPI0030778B68